MAKQPDFQYVGEEIPILRAGSGAYQKIQRAMLLALEQQGLITREEQERCRKRLDRQKRGRA